MLQLIGCSARSCNWQPLLVTLAVAALALLWRTSVKRLVVESCSMPGAFSNCQYATVFLVMPDELISSDFCGKAIFETAARNVVSSRRGSFVD